MRTKSIALAGGAALLLAACAGSQKPAQQYSPSFALDCSDVTPDTITQVYAPGAVKKVTPLYRTHFVARAIQPVYVSGAKLSIPALPSTTDAYLARALSCHAMSDATASAHESDPLRVPGVERVDVRSSGPMTHISITSTDKHAAKQILAHAQALQEGSVTVEQLSADAPSRSVF